MKKLSIEKMKELFKTIPLTQGYETIVDTEDYDRLVSMGRWHVQKMGENQIYARRQERVDGKQKALLMHRIVMNASKGFHVDHKNGKGLDNRKLNLRLCTKSQNAMNGSSHSDGSSKFKGVWWHKSHNKWGAQIMTDGKLNHLGSFEKEVDAAKAYDKAAKEFHGEFARLNFL